MSLFAHFSFPLILPHSSQTAYRSQVFPIPSPFLAPPIEAALAPSPPSLFSPPPIAGAHRGGGTLGEFGCPPLAKPPKKGTPPLSPSSRPGVALKRRLIAPPPPTLLASLVLPRSLFCSRPPPLSEDHYGGAESCSAAVGRGGRSPPFWCVCVCIERTAATPPPPPCTPDNPPFPSPRWMLVGPEATSPLREFQSVCGIGGLSSSRGGGWP